MNGSLVLTPNADKGNNWFVDSILGPKSCRFSPQQAFKIDTDAPKMNLRSGQSLLFEELDLSPGLSEDGRSAPEEFDLVRAGIVRADRASGTFAKVDERCADKRYAFSSRDNSSRVEKGIVGERGYVNYVERLFAGAGLPHEIRNAGTPWSVKKPPSP